MVTRLAPDARSLISNAEAEARKRRSPVVEAEHLLLAMSDVPGSEAAGLLASVGLGHDAIETALSREFESSLAAAGVTVSLDSLGRPSPEPPRHLRLSASFKATMERSVTASAGSRQIRPAHLLLGILGAQVGTVPRALALSGVDRAELARRTRESLSA
jgi:D-alanyl-D-alanine carboxypeptidase